ncbi:MAG: hypothetical protein ACYC7E_02625 [Armatimonadota bacterium]
MKFTKDCFVVVSNTDGMSQGKKFVAAPSLFIPSGDPYAHIPKRHFYARLNALIDLSFVRQLTASLYAAKMGRPSLDPVVFLSACWWPFLRTLWRIARWSFAWRTRW